MQNGNALQPMLENLYVIFELWNCHFIHFTDRWKGLLKNYIERNFINRYKGIFHQKFGTFYAEVEVLGKLLLKERASSNHVHKFWSYFRQISINKNAHTKPLISPQIFVSTFNYCFLFLKRPKSFAVAWNWRDFVSNSEDYIMIFYHGFGGAVETGLEFKQKHDGFNAVCIQCISP